MKTRLSCAWLAGLVLLAGLHDAAWAQASAPAALAAASSETLALDMREEVLRTQVTVKDMYGREETRPMPITIYRPAGDGPYPVVVMNHGRPVPAKRAAQKRFRPESLARYFVAKGLVVLVPMRVGYWETLGDFDPEDSGNCGSKRVQAMHLAASQQVLAAMAFAKTLTYADTSRWLVAGQSVGGLTSVATVARHPPGLLGGINFSGGTGGNPDTRPGNPCDPAALARHWETLAKGAEAPMLWLYWQNDKFNGEDAPKRWHRAWQEGGGKAEFHSLPPVGEDGHSGFNIDMERWLPLVDAFMVSLGFTQNAIVKAPPPSGFARQDEVDKVPVRETGRAGYRRFLELTGPRAFAVSSGGGYGFAHGDYAVGHALGNCMRLGAKSCKLYAVDDQVVWTK